MSAFSGRQYRGARKAHKAVLRAEAEERNAAYQARKRAETEEEDDEA